MSGQDDLGSPHGGGPQGEPIEGSLTDGGSLPGAGREDRSFGAGQPGSDEEAALPSGAPKDGGEAGPGTEHSGYGNTPPR